MNQSILCTFLVFCLFTTALSESLLNRILDTKEKYRRMWETERSGEELDENEDFTIKRGRARNVDRLARMHGTAGIAGKRSSPDFATQSFKNCAQLQNLLANAQQEWLVRHLDMLDDVVLKMCKTTQVLGNTSHDNP